MGPSRHLGRRSPFGRTCGLTRARGPLSVPLIMVFGPIYITNSSTASAADAPETAEFSISYTDASGIITPEQAGLFNATMAGGLEDGVSWIPLRTLGL